ncbi:hypothetical protein NTGBS_880005 [Candidatus Nitrotoga sp. BS]|uniref:hypothetical protein n=1 Tax=Candidatus Nitrotoga sp. BS TaxID=2890408 RepID=UPI001EF279F2|nr:hypothetical protein [Candidatus Nitrotoga sp. BS]CAH1210946.1 hypothetical protein NTGBS_880005 [Candidatus Nitrotoga sp. BS]
MGGRNDCAIRSPHTGAGKDIKTIDQKISAHSELAQTIGSLPGFGKTSMAKIAGEVGPLERFKWLCRK